MASYSSSARATQSCTHQKFADAAVGNVTGSNAVNVFLGLGLPWMISSIYWSSKGDQDGRQSGSSGYYLPKGSLGVSVIVFCCLAALAIVIMLIRNHFFGGVLGGSERIKKPTAVLFVAMWALYVTIATLKAYEVIDWDV